MMWAVGQRVFAVTENGRSAWDVSPAVPEHGFLATVVRVTPSGRAFINEDDVFLPDGSRYGSYRSMRTTDAFRIREVVEGDAARDIVERERMREARRAKNREMTIHNLTYGRHPWSRLTDEQLATVLGWLAADKPPAGSAP